MTSYKEMSREELVKESESLKKAYDEYKALGLKDKLPSMTEEEQLALLATDGMLVKRPILITEKGLTTGFRQAEWEVLL